MESLNLPIDPNVLPALALLLGLLLGGALLYWIARSRAKAEASAVEALWNERFDAERALNEERLEGTRRELAVSTVERDRLRGALDEQRASGAVLSEERARYEQVVEEKNHLIARLEVALREQHEERSRLQGVLTEREKALSTATTRLEEQEKQNAERLLQLEEAKRKMAAEFENLANRILEEKGKKFAEQSHADLAHTLNPLREQLEGFRTKVEEIHRNDTRERGALVEQLRNLHELNRRITAEAANLTKALKGDKKAQGNWGELILERVLEESGLRKDHEYEVQGSFRDEEGRLRYPDVIIHLPDNKQLVVDSKVSLLAYTELVAAEEEADRAVALKAHVEAVRNHIKGLSEKDYSALPGLHSLDFVLMFMPIEAAFMAAFEADQKLFSDAFERKIAVVTPTTLLATVRTIESIWRYERQNENAKRIADRAGAVYDKLRGFVEDMEKLGNQINTLNGTYDAAMNKLTEGRGNLIRQAERFVELGVKVKKSLPAALIEKAGAEHEVAEAVFDGDVAGGEEDE
ncbi:DNA recombination protein RmuC [Endothiovibrio diazotrophicus]